MSDGTPAPPLGRDELKRLLRDAFPEPDHQAMAAEDAFKRIERELFGGDEQVVRFSGHMRKFLRALSEDDVRRMETLLSLSPKTVAWIAEKNERELNNLDGAVEFITSSRTAARVLMWVAGAVATFLTGTWALAKAGIDAFSLLRGGVR